MCPAEGHKQHRVSCLISERRRREDKAVSVCCDVEGSCQVIRPFLKQHATQLLLQASWPGQLTSTRGQLTSLSVAAQRSLKLHTLCTVTEMNQWWRHQAGEEAALPAPNSVCLFAAGGHNVGELQLAQHATQGRKKVIKSGTLSRTLMWNLKRMEKKSNTWEMNISTRQLLVYMYKSVIS